MYANMQKCGFGLFQPVLNRVVINLCKFRVTVTPVASMTEFVMESLKFKSVHCCICFALRM